MDKLFSIIIPTFNRFHSILKSIESVLAQTSQNLELIIIDDGSTDNTGDAIQKYLVDTRIKYYFQENRGVSAARNKGLAESKGDFVIFLDSDDLLLPGLISKLNSLDLENLDLIFWEVKKLFEDRTEIWKPSKLEKIYNNITASFLAGSACYKRAIIIEVGGFDEKLHFGENYELGMRIAQIQELKYKVVDDIFLIYEIKAIRENSLPLNKIAALKYLTKKHKYVYEQDPASYSRLLYQLGYLFEKINKNSEAREYFYKAWKVRPVYLKALIKVLQFKWL